MTNDDVIAVLERAKRNCDNHAMRKPEDAVRIEARRMETIALGRLAEHDGSIEAALEHLRREGKDG